jgi:hypothetical protein
MWPAAGEELVVRTIIQEDPAAAKRNAQYRARDNAVKIGSGVWMWWTDGLRADDVRVAASAVCKYGNQWMSRHSFLGTGPMEVFDAELRAIGLAIEETIEKRETLQWHAVKTVGIFNDWNPAIVD